MGELTDFDMIANINTIESLKYDLLASTCALHGNLLQADVNLRERGDILSQLLVTTYLLSERLGIPFNSLDTRAMNKLKTGLLTENNPLQIDYTRLFGHMNQKKE